MTTSTTSEIALTSELTLRLTELAPIGSNGRTALVLHGGGGVGTVRPIADHLAGAGWRVLLPTHPGWDGTIRPDGFATVDDLALAYLHLLAERDLTDVLVVGGWIAAQLGVIDAGARVGRLVIIDGVGVEVPEEPMPDFFALTPREVAEHSYHDPDRFTVDPATVTAEQRAAIGANLATLRVYAGDPYMHDPRLAGRLGWITAPTTLIWGASDRIVTPAYGKAYAASIDNPRARVDFVVIDDAGHLPQLEQPEKTFRLIDAAAR